MILVYQELLELVANGAIDADPRQVGPSSIDVHLGDDFWLEEKGSHISTFGHTTHPASGNGPQMVQWTNSVLVPPGGFCLAATKETVRIPDDISVEFRLRSTVARCGMNHALAIWVDPGFVGNITLELVNTLQHHEARLVMGDRIGQLIFHRHSVTQRPYRGVYRGDTGVARAKAH